MSDGKAKRRIVWAIVTPCLAAFLTFLLMYDQPSHVKNSRNRNDSGGSGQKDNQTSYNYQSVPLSWTLRQEVGAFLAERHDAPNPDRDCDAECQRGHKDLYAQLEMAVWTQGMFWAALGSVLVTAIGVVFVALTLNATKNATRAAAKAAEAADDAVTVTREIGEKQVRAYLTIRNVKVLKYEANRPLKASIHIQNIGQTPAIDVSIRNDFPYEIANRENKARFDGGAVEHMKYAIAPGMTSKMFASRKGNIADTWIDSVKEEKSLRYFVTIVSYSDVFGQLHETGYRGSLNAESVRDGKPFFQICEEGNYST